MIAPSVLGYVAVTGHETRNELHISRPEDTTPRMRGCLHAPTISSTGATGAVNDAGRTTRRQRILF
jgi:hypothetical protein